ncbi:MAG: hypothetical protein AVDCRST_MAG48-3814 [uncultured Friedmanniella sp.]|uniref:Uncharacterized protein n=1 Tax=uncultured Friedmanniella sp. TaxID=335381 RepID=A0A6J4M1L9_9ACTN|nr:MAG: hypothetical protein AVDCRST_MAG48-3814 [uncultured Friedmanniella sp.]
MQVGTETDDRVEQGTLSPPTSRGRTGRDLFRARYSGGVDDAGRAGHGDRRSRCCGEGPR